MFSILRRRRTKRAYTTKDRLNRLHTQALMDEMFGKDIFRVDTTPLPWGV